MAEVRKKFDALEASRPAQKFVPQEINLHFDYRLDSTFDHLICTNLCNEKIRWILDICTHPRVIKAVKELLGPNIVLLSSAVFTKYPTDA